MSAKIYVNGMWKDFSKPQVAIMPVVDQFCYRNEPKRIPIEVSYGNSSPFGTIVVEGLPSYARYEDNAIIVEAPESEERETHEISVKLIEDNVILTGIKFLLKVAGSSYVSTEGLYVKSTTIFQEDEYNKYPDITDPTRCVGPVSNDYMSPYKILDGLLYRDMMRCSGAPDDGSYAVMFAHNTSSTIGTVKCYVLHSNGLIYPVYSNEYQTVTNITGAKKISGYTKSSTAALFMTESQAGFLAQDGTTGILTIAGVTDVSGPASSEYQYGGFVATGPLLYCCKCVGSDVEIFSEPYEFSSPIVQLSQGEGTPVYVRTESGKLYKASVVNESTWDVVEIVASGRSKWSVVSGIPYVTYSRVAAFGICDGYLYVIFDTVAQQLKVDYPVTAVSGSLYYAVGDPTGWKGGMCVSGGYLYGITTTTVVSAITDVDTQIAIGQITNNNEPVFVGPTAALYGGLSGSGVFTSTIQTGMVVAKKYDILKYGDDPLLVPISSVNGAMPSSIGNVALQAEFVPGDSYYETTYSSSNGVYSYATATQPEMISLSFYSSGDGTATSYGYIEAGTYNSADQTFVRRAYGVLSPAKNAAITLTFMVAPGEVPAFRYESGKTFPAVQVRAVINKFTISVSPA